MDFKTARDLEIKASGSWLDFHDLHMDSSTHQLKGMNQIGKRLSKVFLQAANLIDTVDLKDLSPNSAEPLQLEAFSQNMKRRSQYTDILVNQGVEVLTDYVLKQECS